MSVMPKQVDTFLDNPAGKWYSSGLDYLYQNKLDYALNCFDSAINLNKNYCMPWLLKGILLSLTEKQDDAITCYKEAIKISPNKIQKTFEKKIIDIDRILKPDESVRQHVIKNFNIALVELPQTPTLYEKLCIFFEKIKEFFSITPKGSIDHAQLVKIKQAKIEVSRKIDYIFEYDIKIINEKIKSTYDKAIKSSSQQEEIFLAKKIKNLQQILNSKWETLDKLQRIQHYFERILAVNDIGVSLKEFGLQEFSGKAIEDFVIDVKINSDDMDKKIELTEVITSTPINHDTGEEDLKDILDEIRLKKEVIKE